MRARFYDDSLLIDLIDSESDVIKVVRLALGTGLTDIRIGQMPDEKALGIRIRTTHDTFAGKVSGDLLAVVAGVEGKTPEKLLEDWRRRNAQFAALEKELNGSED